MLRDRFGSLGFRKMVERLRRKKDALFARRDAPALELVDVKARRISAPGRPVDGSADAIARRPGRPVDGSADAIARRQMTERRRQHLKRHKARRPDGGYGNFPEAAGVVSTSNPLRRGGAASGYGGDAAPGYGAYPAPPATVGGVNPMRRGSAAPAGVAYANYAAPDATVAGVSPMRRDQPAEDTYAHYAAPDATVAGVNPMRRDRPAEDTYAHYAAPDSTVAGDSPIRRGQEPGGGILPWASVRHSASQNTDSADV